MALVQNYAPSEDLTVSQLIVGPATATLPVTEWSSLSGVRRGYRIFTDPDTANEGEALLLSDPQFQSLTVDILIIKPIQNLTTTSGNWSLRVPATREVKEYLPRHIRNTLLIPEYYDSIQDVTIDEINDAVQRFRNFRRWDVMDQEYLDLFLQTMGMFFKSEQFDIETRRRFIKELPTFIELAGTKFFINYLSFVVGAFFEIRELWSTDYENFIIQGDIPVGLEDQYYPTNHVELEVDANSFGIVNVDLVIDIFYVLASVPLVLQRINQILLFPDIQVQSPTLIQTEEYVTFTDITP